MKNPSTLLQPDGAAQGDRFEHYIEEHTNGNAVLLALTKNILTDFEAGQMLGIDVRPTPESAVALRLFADAIDYAWEGYDPSSVTKGSIAPNAGADVAGVRG